MSAGGRERDTTPAVPEARAAAVAPRSVAPPAAAILRLQRCAGNRAVAGLLERRAGHVSPDVAGDRVGRAIGSRSTPLGDTASLHTDAAAQKLTRQLGVEALAVGSHVFARPDTSPEVLDHELVHVEQARRDPSVRATLEPARRAAAEREARDPGDGPVRESGLVHYYGEAGHFYTAYLVALAVGFDDHTAFHIAFFTQMPDEVSELDATDMALGSVAPVLLDSNAETAVRERDAVQRGGHALTGRPSAEERARRVAVAGTLSPESPEFGLAVHALGDSFAHSTIADESRMYNPVSGHLAQFVSGDPHSPDFISRRPRLYMAYVQALYRAFTAAAARAAPEHRDAARMKDEQFVLELAQEVATLPEDEQVAKIRELAANRLGRPMDAYSPELVEERPYTQFAADPGPGRGHATPEARRAAAEIPLWRAQGFDAMQAGRVPSPVVPQSDALNLSGFGYDATVAAGGVVTDIGTGAAARTHSLIEDTRREWQNAQLQLAAEMRQFFSSTYGYGF